MFVHSERRRIGLLVRSLLSDARRLAHCYRGQSCWYDYSDWSGCYCSGEQDRMVNWMATWRDACYCHWSGVGSLVRTWVALALVVVVAQRFVRSVQFSDCW